MNLSPAAAQPLYEQPWFVLDSSQYAISAAAAGGVSHYYCFDVAQSASATVVVPDGCVDVIFDCNAGQPRARVCGTALNARRVELLPNHRYFGARFRPGVIPGFLAVTAEDLTDQEHDLRDVTPQAERLLERIVLAPGFAARIQALGGFVDAHLAVRGSRLTQWLIAQALAGKGDVRIGHWEAKTGVNRRTLQRQFKRDTGLAPKAFCRIVRGQAAMNTLLDNPEVCCSDLAAELGFSDQSHFLRDFKTLTSTTPHDYQRRLRQEGYGQRIHRLEL
ncbi:helix-turn-helix domain-containing protein [Pseudomonas oryzihabitans]|uniref:helix-turn-helix domain-containing protein n=1 Tax=Pseudomonas oryzihabitans TaxID=47885 RepID=UPI002894E136|nr:helix-turn-helix domain-containing protein [Pseudomonas oryzihabitans]MDT3722454.1 helix-turn-helix domain-containing protein [Pseudomonas oryzihabitans]